MYENPAMAAFATKPSKSHSVVRKSMIQFNSYVLSGEP